MSKPPASHPDDSAAPGSNNQTENPKTDADEKDGMEEAQEDAAEERATDGGYQ